MDSFRVQQVATAIIQDQLVATVIIQGQLAATAIIQAQLVETVTFQAPLVAVGISQDLMEASRYLSVLVLLIQKEGWMSESRRIH